MKSPSLMNPLIASVAVICSGRITAQCGNAIRSCCVLRRALEKAQLAFIEVLDGYSLSDLVRPRAPMRALLGIAPFHTVQRPNGA